jgi:hypothetical protein
VLLTKFQKNGAIPSQKNINLVDLRANFSDLGENALKKAIYHDFWSNQ